MRINIFSKKLLFVTVAISLAIVALSFTAPSQSEVQALSSSSATTNIKKFVKTKNKCSTCSCSGYWGYKHDNGTYEGSCSNTDKWGYKCSHGPEKHGLKKW